MLSGYGSLLKSALIATGRDCRLDGGTSLGSDYAARSTPMTSKTAPAHARAGRAGAQPRQRPGLALLVIVMAQLMVVLDSTIVMTALPRIQHALGFSGAGLQWVVTGYAITFGGLMLLGGRAGDLLGRTRVFVAGLVLFSAASLAGGLAQGPGMLLAMRAVQGAGGAMIAPAALALITTTFPEGQPRNRRWACTRRCRAAGP
jgi:sugar phosphate permease